MNQVTRLALVDRADAKLSIMAQCRLLKVARSSLYWRPVAASQDDLRLMRRIDELYLMTPFYGARRMVAVLRRDGWTVNRKRVRRLMRLMRIEAIYQQPNTSRRHPDHVYPYLLRGLAIDRPNQVWCADITYIPLAKGFVCKRPVSGVALEGLTCRSALLSGRPRRSGLNVDRDRLPWQVPASPESRDDPTPRRFGASGLLL
jgi:HTH-like domain